MCGMRTGRRLGQLRLNSVISACGEKLTRRGLRARRFASPLTGSVKNSDLRGFEMTVTRQRLVEWRFVPLGLGRL